MKKRGWLKPEQQDEVVLDQEQKEDTKLIAKKDFVISHNGYLKKIKAGEDISDVPSVYHANLKTEGIL